MELVPSDALTHYGASVTDELKEPGDRIGRFEISERLTVTLIGALYRVFVRPAGGTNLLHVIPVALAQDPNLRARLQKRIDSLSQMDSEIVMTPLAVVDFDDTLAIVYKDQAGIPFPTLRANQSELIPQSLEDVRAFLKKVILAVEVAGGGSAHHFGLTPDFLILVPDGNIRVWGFGVVEVIDRRQFEIFISSAIVPLKQGVDDPDYTMIEALSPEWRNDDSIDVRADLYGLGVLTFNILTHRRLSDETVRPSEFRQDVTEGWDYVVGRLLEPDPQDRYQTLAAVSTDLDRIERLGADGVARSSDGALGRLYLPDVIVERMSRRTRTLVQVAGIVLAVLLLVQGFFAYQRYAGLHAAEGSNPSVVLAGENPPNLVLLISPNHARIRFIQEEKSDLIFETTTGRIELLRASYAYTVVVESPGYVSHAFELSRSDTFSERRVELDLAVAKLRLKAPAGSRLDLRRTDGTVTFLDTVPSSGTLEIEDRLLAGQCELIVSHPRCEPMEMHHVSLLAGQWVELNAPLEALKVDVEIRSSPSGALVSINGTEVGQTPLVVADVPVDPPFELVVGGGPLRPWHQTVQPLLEGPNLIDAGVLAPSEGTLQLNLTLAGRTPTPEELQKLRLKVGDDVYSGNLAMELKIPAGVHTIQVSHSNYATKMGEVMLEDRETKVLSADLRPLPATIEFDLPPGSTVIAEVDGTRRTLSEGKLQIEPLRDVKVLLRAYDFLPIESVFTMEPNATIRWQPDWKPLPGPLRGESWIIPHLDIPLVWASPGSFQMGSPLTEIMRYPNEGPVTSVRLTAGFWVSSTEVTQAAYQALMGKNPSFHRGPQNPVDSVSWFDAREFCQRLTVREREAGRLPGGYAFRLPSEAEWEYAARAGESDPFSFGRRADGGEGNFQGRYPRDYHNVDSAMGSAGSVSVGQFPPNAWGLFDVHGNIAEWTLDAYNDRLPGREQVDYRRVGEGRGKPVRGGSWSDLADRCRSATRESVDPEVQRPFIGFRIVLAPPG